MLYILIKNKISPNYSDDSCDKDASYNRGVMVIIVVVVLIEHKILYMQQQNKWINNIWIYIE